MKPNPPTLEDDVIRNWVELDEEEHCLEQHRERGEAVLALEPLDPIGIILYKDNIVIRKILDRLTALALYRLNLVKENNRLTPASSPEEFFIQLEKLAAGVTQALNPSLARLTRALRGKSEIQREWKLDSSVNIDHICLQLLSVIPIKKSVSELCELIESCKSRETRVDDSLLYPTMPIAIRGKLRNRRSIQVTRLTLFDKQYSAKVFLGSGKKLDLGVEPSFLLKQDIFIIGTIEQMGPIISIKAGAILL